MYSFLNAKAWCAALNELINVTARRKEAPQARKCCTALRRFLACGAPPQLNKVNMHKFATALVCLQGGQLQWPQRQGQWCQAQEVKMSCTYSKVIDQVNIVEVLLFDGCLQCCMYMRAISALSLCRVLWAALRVPGRLCRVPWSFFKQFFRAQHLLQPARSLTVSEIVLWWFDCAQLCFRTVEMHSWLFLRTDVFLSDMWFLCA